MSLKLKPEQVSPLVWKSMSLYGFGPYVKPVCINIKPLTILCGINGSGKSTWTNVLKTLKGSFEKGLLPFAVEDSFKSLNYGITNSLLSHKDGITSDENKHKFDFDYKSKYGPAGSVGFLLESTRDFNLTKTKSKPIRIIKDEQFSRFLSDGSCPAGTLLRIIITHPHPEEVSGCLPTGFQLSYDSQKIIFHSLDNESYDIMISSSIINAKSDDDALIILGKGRVSQEQGCCDFIMEKTTSKSHKLLCDLVIKRVQDVFGVILGSWYHIGAIREPFSEGDIYGHDTEEMENILARARYVGEKGEHTHFLKSKYFNNVAIGLQDASPDASLYNGFHNWFERLWSLYFQIAYQDTDIYNHINSIVSKETRDRLVNMFTVYKDQISELSELRNVIFRDLDDRSRHVKAAERYKDCTGIKNIFSEIVGRYINETLASPGFYNPKLWPSISEHAKFFISQGIDNLNAAELIRLNTCLLLERMNEPRYHHLIFDIFICYWLNKLFGITCSLDEGLSGEHDCVCEENFQLPNCLLINFEPSPDKNWLSNNPRECCRYFSENFRPVALPAGPINFSSGYHQVMPMIVQLGLMKINELCSIENPEVHLHPGLQLKLTEFLIEQAKIGKYMLVETQSDLLIRRCLRAILEEETSEHFISINFISSIGCSSIVEPIKFDEAGRIANWPKGFLDDSIKESQMLVDALYGNKDYDDDSE